ncbi:MAG TPA: TonB-dependent receptor [Longimicrobiaceae bacterium]|nr:TonB-dependent receptor [Longimicrobiaceae bacterium]
MRRDAVGSILLLLLLLSPAAAEAQTPEFGRILGRVVDGETGRPLPGAQLYLQGTRIGSLSGVEGRYILLNVPSGQQTLVVSFLGYTTKTITNVAVPAGGVVAQDVALDPGAVAIQGVTVSAERERGTVSRTLNEQRHAVGVVNAVSLEQIARSPDGDAAAAVQRVSGVTVQDGKYVFVRGLGERYTTTSLNGARIPSPEPERRVVPLDLFPSGLLSTITTSKTFTPNQPGDFSGAQVDVRTREFPSSRQVSYSFSVGGSTAATGRTVLSSPNEGFEWLALGRTRRGVPEMLVQYGNFQRRAPGPEEMNQIVNSFRNVWSARESVGRPNTSFGGATGGTTELFGRSVGYVGSATYSHRQSVQIGQVRALPRVDGTGAGTISEVDRYEGESGSTSVLWGGILNLSTMLGANNRIALNNSYNRSADHDARREEGFSENLGIPLLIERLRYVERGVRSNQLVGEHQLTSRSRFDWTASSSGVVRVEPDRSEVVYARLADPASGEFLPPVWAGGSSEGAVRTFGELTETGWEGAANYRLTLGQGERQHEMRFGGLVRWMDRAADNAVYSISSFPLTANRSAVELPPEELFGGRFSRPGDENFNVLPLGQGGSYAANDILGGGYVMAEYTLSPRMRLIGGARLEHSDVLVDAENTVGQATRVNSIYTDVLPSLALNLRITEQQTLRFSASQTLSRPEYRELAPVQYREVIGGSNVIGNPDLRRTLIRNFDARWEWYPNAAEVLSVALFAKQFIDPIERLYLGTSGTAVETFSNAESADNYGIEVEARRGLGGFDPRFERWSVFANATLMHSDVRIGEDAFATRTEENRPMVGQAPYVLNAGLTYATPSARSSATLLYNVVGPRLTAAGGGNVPNAEEQPRHVLDFSLRAPLTSTLALKFDAKDLLDSPYKVTQGPVLRDYYRTGRAFSLGVTYSLSPRRELPATIRTRE